MNYIIRQVRPEDLEEVTEVEKVCFPAAEAAARESFQARIEAFPESFLVAEAEGGKIIGFINGAVTDRRTISDDMFEDAGLHKKDGAYQSIFGLDILPDWQRQGIAADLMEKLMETAKKRGKKGMILTCKDKLIHYYVKFGYENVGVSESVHGGAVWYDMIVEF